MMNSDRGGEGMGVRILGRGSGSSITRDKNKKGQILTAWKTNGKTRTVVTKMFALQSVIYDLTRLSN